MPNRSICSTLSVDDLKSISKAIANLADSIGQVASEMEKQGVNEIETTGVQTMNRGRKYISSWVGTLMASYSDSMVPDSVRSG